jgi:putative copper resistance protein D
VTTFLVLARAVHFGSCLLLQAVFVVLFLILKPAWAGSAEEWSRGRVEIQRLLQRMLVVSLVLAFCSGFGWLWLAVAGMSGSTLWDSLQPSLLWMVLTQTSPGHIWLVRAGIAAALAVGLFFGPVTRRGSPGASLAFGLCAALAMSLTASLAWLGHAGASEGPGQNLELGSDIIHLIASGAWPGGLAPLALFLGCYLRNHADAGSLEVACVVTRRFSAVSLVAVGALAVSGLANSYYLVGGIHALVTTEYGRLLMAKVVLFIAMIAIGGWNLCITRKRLGRSPELPPDELQSGALATVARNVGIEIALGTLVLIAVGALGAMAPAIHEAMGM